MDCITFLFFHNFYLFHPEISLNSKKKIDIMCECEFGNISFRQHLDFFEDKPFYLSK